QFSFDEQRWGTFLLSALRDHDPCSLSVGWAVLNISLREMLPFVLLSEREEHAGPYPRFPERMSQVASTPLFAYPFLFRTVFFLFCCWLSDCSPLLPFLLAVLLKPEEIRRHGPRSPRCDQARARPGGAQSSAESNGPLRAVRALAPRRAPLPSAWSGWLGGEARVPGLGCSPRLAQAPRPGSRDSWRRRRGHAL